MMIEQNPSENWFSSSDENLPSHVLVTQENDPTPKNPSPESSVQCRRSLQCGICIYRDDIVKHNTDGSSLGIVQEVGGQVDSDSDITDDEDDEDDDNEDDDDDDVDEDLGDEGDEDNSSLDHEGVESQEFEDDHEADGEDKSSDEGDALAEGQVRVLWLDNSESIHSVHEVTVVDRGFLHGDIVASIDDPIGELGTVVDAHIVVDLQAADGSTIKDISTKDLRRVRDFFVGDYVVLGYWLGRVDELVDNVTVLLDDGSCCKILKADHTKLKPLGRNYFEDINSSYHPGQRVKATSSSVLKNSKWLSGTWKANRMEGTVVKVQQAAVFVYWIASAVPGRGYESSGIPTEKQKPKDLTLLSCFIHANWEVGDWCLLSSQSTGCASQIYLPNKDTRGVSKYTVDHVNKGGCISDSLVPQGGTHGFCDNAKPVECNKINESELCNKSLSIVDPIHGSGSIYRKRTCKTLLKKDKKLRKRMETLEKALLIVNIKTKVDVAWQNGAKEHGRDGKTLIPIEIPGDKDFFPEQYVVEKTTEEGEHVAKVARAGVVKSVNAKDRTALIRWLHPVSDPDEPRRFASEEMMSVYELEGHPDYDYCYGDVVVRLSSISPVAQSPNSGSRTQETESCPVTVEVNRRRKKDSNIPSRPLNECDPALHSLTWVGSISGLQDGEIEVTWANGIISKVGPQSIYVVGRDEDVIGNPFDAASWETFERREDTPEDKEKIISSANLVSNKSEADNSSLSVAKDHGRGALSIPMAALGFVSRLASGLLSRRKNSSDSVSLRGSSSEGTIECKACTSAELRAGPINVEETALGDVKVEHSEQLSIFKHFEIAADPSDHYYFNLGTQNVNGGRKWVKKIQQEWNILQKNVPDEIYVRVYEDRMDLLRAVIIGASGTPYQDGLFFFDFQFPADYPQAPPLVYYRSGGLRINPNLYEDGRVCLSLLNTWNGKGNEIWDSSSSSVLQVLVSLQGLVLNSKPYFNEAGYDKQVGTAEGERNSLSYNENAFLLNCKTMLYTLHRSPKHFEEFVRQHFQVRGPFILKACEEYMKGRQVGTLLEGEHHRTKDSNSVGFRLMLQKLVPKLLSGFCDVGVEQHLVHVTTGLLY